MRLTQRLACSLLFTSGAAAQIMISSINVEGNQRLRAAAIVQDSGLRLGQTVSRTDLDAAAQKLFETGFFTSMNYRYNPVAGKQPPQQAVTFVVAEDRADMPVRIEIPGMDEEKLWSELRTIEPLADRTMPHNDRASDLYCRALERVMKSLG